MSWVACPVGGVCRLRARRHFLQHAASRRRRLAAAHRLCRQLLHEGAGLPHERSRGRFSLSAGLCSRQLYALRIQPARRHGACGQPGGRGIPAGRHAASATRSALWQCRNHRHCGGRHPCGDSSDEAAHPPPDAEDEAGGRQPRHSGRDRSLHNRHCPCIGHCCFEAAGRSCYGASCLLCAKAMC